MVVVIRGGAIFLSESRSNHNKIDFLYMSQEHEH